MLLKWYVVHTQAGCEEKARLALQERAKQHGLEASFGQMLIPSAPVVEGAKGAAKTTQKKFYPGYMFVQIELNEKTYHLVRDTAKITGFLGGKKPTPVQEKDIVTINTQMVEGQQKPKSKFSFEVGESVRVIEGPFANFAGLVEEVKNDKQKLKVKVTIFGRTTAIELDFSQVEKS